MNEKKGTLAQLNDVLFEQIGRLTADGVDGDALKAEIDRSRAVSSLAKDVISNSRLILDANREAIDGTTGEQLGTVARKCLE